MIFHHRFLRSVKKSDLSLFSHFFDPGRDRFARAQALSFMKPRKPTSRLNWSNEPVSGDAGQKYCTAAGQYANLLIENNTFDDFDGSNDPIIYQTNGEGTAEVTYRGNDFSTASGDRISTGGAFEASDYYSYALDGASEVPRLVTAGAGRQ